MTGQEVRNLTNEELAVELKNQRSKLHTLRTQVVTEKVEDVSAFKRARRDIARLLTEQGVRRKTAAQKA